MKDIPSKITVLVVGLLLTLVSIPILIELVDSLYEKTPYDNTIVGLPLSEIDENSSSTLVWEGGLFTKNGNSLSVPVIDSQIALILTPNVIVTSNGETVNVITSTGTITATSSLSIIASGGNITYSVDDASVVQTTYTTGYFVDVNGDYGVCSGTKYFEENSQISGYRYDSNLYVMIDGIGYKNGEIIPMTIRSEFVEDTEEQIRTLSSVNYSSSKGLSFILAPDVVYSEITEYDTVTVILYSIPVLIGIGFVLLVASTLFTRKRV